VLVVQLEVEADDLPGPTGSERLQDLRGAEARGRAQDLRHGTEELKPRRNVLAHARPCLSLLADDAYRLRQTPTD